MDYQLEDNGVLALTTKPTYECPIHGPLEHIIDINIKDFESINGKYCLVCLAKFLAENFPRMKEIK